MKSTGKSDSHFICSRALLPFCYPLLLSLFFCCTKYWMTEVICFKPNHYFHGLAQENSPVVLWGRTQGLEQGDNWQWHLPALTVAWKIQEKWNRFSSFVFVCLFVFEVSLNTLLRYTVYISSCFFSCSFKSASVINRRICTNISFNKSMWLNIVSKEYMYTFHFKEAKISTTYTWINLHNRVKVMQLIYPSN